MMRFDVDRSVIDPVYLIQFLQTGFVKGQIIKASKDAVNQSSINQQDVKTLRINVPPPEEQRSFAARATAVVPLEASHEKSLAQLETLFVSLQHCAFRGDF